MIDPKLEKQIADVKELLALWRKFHEFFVLGVKGTDITAEKEQKFLELKSRIAMLSDTFMEALTHDQNIGQHVISLVERSITLRHLSNLSGAEVKKMEIEWHEAYLLLNETVGILEEKREALSKVSSSKFMVKKFVKNAALSVSSFLGSIYFKTFAILVAFILVLWALPTFGVLNYSKLKEYKATKPIYKSLVKIYRKTFKGDFPYDEISELEPNTEKRGENEVRERGTGSVTLTQAAQLYFQVGLTNDLRSCQEFLVKDFKYKNDDVRIFFFRYNTILEADNIVNRLKNWKRNNQEQMRMMPFM
ncbi:hypothetical protein J7M23_07210, partial [Candidatus Sumerlaeota bacterium]|nr:hypothetical protein [Candidatus Sumerlaeota bacterium]